MHSLTSYTLLQVRALKQQCASSLRGVRPPPPLDLTLAQLPSRSVRRMQPCETGPCPTPLLFSGRLRRGRMEERQRQNRLMHILPLQVVNKLKLVTSQGSSTHPPPCTDCPSAPGPNCFGLFTPLALRTALQAAAKANKPAVVAMLLEHKRSSAWQASMLAPSVLHAAVVEGHLDVSVGLLGAFVAPTPCMAAQMHACVRPMQ